MTDPNPYQGPPAGGGPRPPAPGIPPPPQPGFGQPPPGYGPPMAPGYGAPAGPTNSNDAVVALVLSIISFLVCPLIPAIIALVFAAKARRAIEASNGWIVGSGMATAARVISWINIGLTLAVLVGVIFFAIVAGLTTAASSNVPVGY